MRDRSPTILVLTTLSLYFATTACGQTSATSVAVAYAKSFITGTHEAFWAYDPAYGQQLASIKHTFPQTMWPEKIRAVKAEFEARFSENNGYSTSGPCYVFFRPGATVEAVDTRALPPARWSVFLKVNYSKIEPAPVVSIFGTGSRKLKSATLRVDVGRAQTTGAFTVNSGCYVVPDTLSLWPTPLLDAGAASKLAYDALEKREFDAPIVTVNQYPTWNLDNRYRETAAIVAELKRLLSKYNFVTKNVRLEDGYFQAQEIQPPDAWQPHAARSRLAAMGKYPLPAYRLNDRVEIAAGSLSQYDVNTPMYVALVRYTGCTPICELMKESRTLDVGRYLFTVPDEDWLKHDWPTEQTRKFYFRWELDPGWFVSNIGR